MRSPWKIVSFYVGTLVAVILLISIVLDYGTRNLSAPDDISGQYQITLTDQGDCSQTADALLVIGQSGSYLSADLLAADAPADQRSRVARGNGALHGQFQSGTIHLTGSSPVTNACLGAQQLELEATLVAGQLEGRLLGPTRTVAFQGQRASVD